MPRFSERSYNNLQTCHPMIKEVAIEAIKWFDFSVVWGHRGEEDQNQAFRMGFSKLPWAQSKHNRMPSEAADFVPYPIDWDDRDRFIYLAGHIMQIAYAKGVDMRWGGDWNRNQVIQDERFQDLAHFELMGLVQRDNS